MDAGLPRIERSVNLNTMKPVLSAHPPGGGGTLGWEPGTLNLYQS